MATAAAPRHPCIHEHSCLRCPLRPDPAQRPRLMQICGNLIARVAGAEKAPWHGEAEGLKISLAGARERLTQTDQIAGRRSAAVSLSTPSLPRPAAQSSGRQASSQRRTFHDHFLIRRRQADRAGHAAAQPLVLPAEIRQLRDYTRLRTEGHTGRLDTMGSWTHWQVHSRCEVRRGA